MSTIYNAAISQAAGLLSRMEDELVTAVINIGMKGVFSEIDDSFDEGDSYLFEPDMFADTGDENLDALIAIITSVRETRASFENLFDQNGTTG